MRFLWVRQCFIQDADDLSKFVDPMDFSLSPEWLAHVWQCFGPWDVDRYASPSNATCPRFNALFDSVKAEGVNSLTQDWRRTVPFVLPNFHELGKIPDITKRDDADAAVVVPEWPYRAWWRRLPSAAFVRRVKAWEFVSDAALIPNTQDCFFRSRFTARLLLLRTRAAGSCAERV